MSGLVMSGLVLKVRWQRVDLASEFEMFHKFKNKLSAIF